MDAKTKARGRHMIDVVDQMIGLIRDDFTDGKFEDAAAEVEELVADVGRLQALLEKVVEEESKTGGE